MAHELIREDMPSPIRMELTRDAKVVSKAWGRGKKWKYIDLLAFIYDFFLKLKYCFVFYIIYKFKNS